MKQWIRKKKKNSREVLGGKRKGDQPMQRPYNRLLNSSSSHLCPQIIIIIVIWAKSTRPKFKFLLEIYQKLRSRKDQAELPTIFSIINKERKIPFPTSFFPPPLSHLSPQLSFETPPKEDQYKSGSGKGVPFSI